MVKFVEVDICGSRYQVMEGLLDMNYQEVLDIVKNRTLGDWVIPSREEAESFVGKLFPSHFGVYFWTTTIIDSKIFCVNFDSVKSSLLFDPARYDSISFPPKGLLIRNIKAG